jgi:acetyltransferase-like isoleucine patch superfamily enzyme
MMIRFISRAIFFFIKLPIKLYYFFVFEKNSILSFIDKPLKIDGGKNISIGKRVSIQYKTWLAALPLTGEQKCELVIKDGTVIGHFNHIYATKSIIIEENVLTADKVYISDNLHDYTDPFIPIMKQKIIQKNQIVIGAGSWIGENVSIIGASVGKNSVIGANSVVTKDIPDYCVAAGIPAKIIKRYNFERKQWERTTPQGEFLE